MSGLRQAVALPTPEDILLGNVGGRTVRSNMPQISHQAGASGLASGTLRATPIALYAGDVINYLTFRTDTQAAVSPTAWWFALYDDAATPALLAQTADQTTTAWAASTTMTKQLLSTITITRTGLYYATAMMAAATPVNIAGVTKSGAAVGTQLSFFKGWGATNNTGLTTTAPPTMGPVTLSTTAMCVVASSAN